MPRSRSVLTLALLAAPLAVALADDAARETRSWSGPAAAAAEAAAKSDAPSPTTAAPTPTPAIVPPLNAAADAGLPVPPAPKPAVAPTKAAAVPEPATTEPPKPSVTEPQTPAPEKVEDKPEKGAKKDTKKPTPAKDLFGAAKTAAPLAARAIGWYAKGCLAGAKPLAIDGPTWQVMRLSRNRNWGHPTLVALVERLAAEVKASKEWPGLLVGDISQPRGGPMTSGHASHQVGLDADIWLTPMPDRRLSEKEREDISATSMLAADEVSVDPKVWGEGQVKLIKRAASYRQVERVLVHPAIKKALCEAAGTDRGWLAKVRPYWGHYYHMHIRIGCPSGSTNCRSQEPPSGDDGCGAELKDWLKKIAPSKEPPKPVAKPAKPEKKKPAITLADLPPECRTVLAAGEKTPPEAPAVAKAKDAEKSKTAKTAAQK